MAGLKTSLTTRSVVILVLFLTIRTLTTTNSVWDACQNGAVFSPPINPPAPSSYLNRIAMFKERYGYVAPEPYRNHTFREEHCGPASDYTFFSRKGFVRSINNEDQGMYRHFFKPEDNEPAVKGTVVEMGAYNGMDQSNSRFFDVCLGWDTLLIEGMPETFKQLVKNRPNAHRMNFAPTCSLEEEAMNKTVLFDNYAQTNAGLADGSVNTSFTYRNWTVEVPCGSLTNVLPTIFPQGHVTFFSLDVEGAEPYVLQNLDFNAVFVEIFMIENKNNFCQAKCQTRDKFRKIMDEHGYRRYTFLIAKSDVFIHPESTYLNKMQQKPNNYDALVK
eukprot:CAMPEP_0178898372 /NCGR_PEP_ID=MMETSP0786-20121207/2294_1 /TAXON_ID=186022 /ORGANISM="Thalassionema frauenfeldii, Strain CCMP 1798" /LENGTH=330 /DNA_ID=CAMNT_0020569083 /DNA_START=30 /DNA_END=1019 /DNA_ORIENTATION=-